MTYSAVERTTLPNMTRHCVGYTGVRVGPDTRTEAKLARERTKARGAVGDGIVGVGVVVDVRVVPDI